MSRRRSRFTPQGSRNPGLMNRSALLRKSAPILLLCILLSALFFSTELYEEYQLAKGLAMAGFCALFFAAASRRITGEKIKFGPAPLFALLMLYPAFRCAASPYPVTAHYMLTLTAPLVFFVPLFHRPDTKKTVLLLNLMLLVSSLYGLAQLWLRVIRPYAFFGNPIFAAEFTALCFPFAVLGLIIFPKARAFFAFNGLLAVVALFATGSRAAMLALFLSAAALALHLIKSGILKFSMPQKHIIYASVPFIIILALLLTTPGFNSSVKSTIARTKGLFSGETAGLKNRLLMANAGSAMIKNSPLAGNGAGSVRHEYQRFQAPELARDQRFEFINTSYIHNDFIQLAAEFGLPAAVIFALFILFVLLRFDSFSRAVPDTDYAVMLCLAAALIAFLAEGFFNFPLFVLPSALLLYFSCGWIYAITCSHDVKALPAKPFAPVLLSLVALFFIVMALYPSFSDAALKKGVNEAVRKSNFEPSFYSQAVQVNPKNYYAYFYQGYYSFSKSQWNDALFAYEKALALQPNSADLLYNIAAIYRMNRDLKKSEEFFRRAIALYPGMALANLNLGKVLVEQGREKEALPYIQKARSLAPEYFDQEIKNEIVSFEEK